MSISEIYAVAPAYIMVGVVVLGFLVGSFLNVVIYRLPKMMKREWDSECLSYIESSEGLSSQFSGELKRDESTFNLAYPNSRCPSCDSPIKAWQNIPVLSYLVLRGKCAGCKSKISFRYPTIEFFSGALSLVVLLCFGPTLQAALALILVWSLIALTMIDIDHHLLPDSITLPLLWLGLLANTQEVFTNLNDGVIGAAAGYLSLWSVYWAFKLITGKEGMGFGDFKLLAVFGAWFGWQYLFLILILSSLVGAVLGVMGIILLGRDKAQPLPFGPYLAGAGLLTLFWGEEILSKYLQFASPSI